MALLSDPVGFGAAPAGGGGSGGGWCFIVSAKDTSPVSSKILTLILPSGFGILVLAGFIRS